MFETSCPAAASIFETNRKWYVWMEWVGSLLYNFFSFVFIISVIVFIHEYGHYIVAKISGVKIEVFSIGFGPEICGINDRSGTRWKLSALPFGGYVKMFGDVDPSSAPDNDKIATFSEEDKKHAFHTQPLSIKAAVVAAGPIANFILAIVILTGFYTAYGKPVTLPEISVVMEESAAAEAGIEVGDVITSIDGQEIESFGDIQRIVSINTGTPLSFIVKRGELEEVLRVTPHMKEREDIFGNIVKAPLIGIASESVSYRDLHAGNAFVEAVGETYFISTATLKAIGQMIVGERGVEELSGPLRIAKYSGQSVEQGMSTILWFMVILSVNLGLINLFPIPVLDGGHLLYYIIEAVRGKPMADKMQEWGFRVGIALVLSLAIFSTFNDLRHLDVF